jgi:probable HAF family extracellular repeat protein
MGKLFKAMGVLALLLSAAVPAKAVVQYTVEPLGSFEPTGINARGDVVGWRYLTTSGSFHSVLYSNGSLKDLGTFGGQSSIAYGINDSGQVVGQIKTLSGSYHAFLYQKDSVIDLNALIDPNLGLTLNVAGAINNIGQIAGICSTATEKDHVFLYDTGSVSHYCVQGAFDVTGINDSGQIIGNYNTLTGNGHGFILNDGVMTDIFASDGNNSGVTCINSSGTVVGGFTKLDYTLHAFQYNNGNISEIGYSSRIITAYGINDSGQIVCSSNAIPAFLYENGNVTDLNEMIDSSLGIILNGTVAINDNGQIVATNSDAEAFLLTPIPEPSIIIHTSIILSYLFICILKIRKTACFEQVPHAISLWEKSMP